MVVKVKHLDKNVFKPFTLEISFDTKEEANSVVASISEWLGEEFVPENSNREKIMSSISGAIEKELKSQGEV